MRKSLSLIAFVVLGAAMMYGQASRTWVSGVGDDANPCSRTAPCKTWAGAISKTAAGGEIDALDPGGFGAVTITKAITLDGGGGQVASVLVAGTNGIVVQAGASDIVIIRNIRINGLNQSGNPGVNGINWLSGRSLHVESCTIFGFNNAGINIAKADGGRAFISNTVVANNAADGIVSKNTTNTVDVTITNTVSSDNTVGVSAQDFSNLSLFGSEITGSNNTAVQVFPAAGTATVEIYNSSISHNSIGLFVGTASGTAWISGVALFDNSSGIVISGGTVNSAKNNYNNGTGTPNATPLTFVQ